MPRGPKKKDLSELGIRSLQRRARANKAALASYTVKPRCPSYLDKDAKVVWRRVAPLLEKTIGLTILDCQRLERYCELSASYWRCEAFLDKHGMTYIITKKRGDIEIHEYPEVRLSLKLDAALAKDEKYFLMTPKDRGFAQV